MKLQLLDCTLRDGGYNNDWEFGHDTLVSVFERVVSAEIDFIELIKMIISITDQNKKNLFNILNKTLLNKQNK